MYNGVWFIRTYNEGYIITPPPSTIYVYMLAAACMCRWQSTFEIHMKTSSLLYSSLAIFFFFSWPLSTAAVNTNKYGRTWEHTTNAYMLGETFRRPERLACDLIQLRRSVKQAICDEETFFWWVASRDTKADNIFVEIVATFGGKKKEMSGDLKHLV